MTDHTQRGLQQALLSYIRLSEKAPTMDQILGFSDGWRCALEFTRLVAEAEQK